MRFSHYRKVLVKRCFDFQLKSIGESNHIKVAASIMFHNNSECHGFRHLDHSNNCDMMIKQYMYFCAMHKEDLQFSYFKSFSDILSVSPQTYYQSTD